MKERTYLVIDIKSFFASVECVERGLDPMEVNLVVADPTRSEGTICLAITPPMKKLGIKNRCRIFEIPKSVEYIVAPPRMQLYIDYAATIYSIYLKYISKDDIHIYSIDEAFLDATDYLALYNMTPYELGKTIMDDIRSSLGIRSTCGIGTNMYLAKIALDITAKHSPDFIGYLNERLYRDTLWNHKPLTDFWRIGPGTARTLARYGIYTMGGIARTDEDFLYRTFGVDAELLIDHAWGIEPTTIADIKKYSPESNSLSNGQVMMRDYGYDEGRLIVKEMMDTLCLDMVDKNLVTSSVTLDVGFSHTLNLPHAHGTVSVDTPTNADIILIPAIADLYNRIVSPDCQIRRFNVTCNNVVTEEYIQYSFFQDVGSLEKNRKMQKAMIDIKKKFGKNAILRGMNFEEGSTMRERNGQIGGHRSGNKT